MPRSELNPLESCREKALRLLEQRPHSRKELVDKLRIRKYDSTTIETILADLERVGLIDDLAFANLFTESKLSGSRPIGRIKLHYELCRRGISSECADQVINNALADDQNNRESELAREAASRKLRTIPTSLDPRKRRERLYRFLASRGFPAHICLDIVNDITSQNNPTDYAD